MAEEVKKAEATEAEAPKEEKKEAPVEEVKKEEPKKEAAPKKEEEKKEVDTSDLSKDAVKVLEMVEKMSILELAELVKVMEEKFGVSAAAPVAVAAAGAPAAGGAAADAAPSEVTVTLVAAGDQKINVIKAVKEITGLGLKEAKEIVDGAPKAVKEGVKPEEAAELQKQLEAAGATVEVK